MILGGVLAAYAEPSANAAEVQPASLVTPVLFIVADIDRFVVSPNGFTLLDKLLGLLFNKEDVLSFFLFQDMLSVARLYLFGR